MESQRSGELGILDGKVALVTGAGQGVGRGISLAFASEGAKVALVGRTLSKLESVQKEIEERGGTAIVIACDVGVAEQMQPTVDRVISEWGTIDILVNNAVHMTYGPVLELQEESLLTSFQVDFFGTLRFMQACYPHLKGGGSIVNLSSGRTADPFPVDYGGYSSVKGAVNQLSRAAAVEWGPDGIRINTVYPLANSPSLQWWLDENKEESEPFMRDNVPLGREGDCEKDIGRAVMQLVGPDLAYVTGGNLVLDGGFTYLR